MQERRFQICVFVITVMTAAIAQAQPSGSAGTPQSSPTQANRCQTQPWYCNVSIGNQQQATALYNEGNQFLRTLEFQDAAEKYRDALKLWDHPAIHYNLMLALIGQEKTIEAYESSIKALQYGVAPFKPEDYSNAVSQQKLLRLGIVELEITCNEPGALVSLDGKLLLTGPGKVRHLVAPGQHEIIAKKKRFFTTNKTLTLVPGKLTAIELVMLPESKATLTERHWATWKPLAVVGAGVGISLVGSALQWGASSANRSFRVKFNAECEAPGGCDGSMRSGEINRWEDRETLYRRLSYGAYVAGGITTMAGVALVYVNRAREVENPERNNLVRISLTPVLSPSVQGLAFQMEY